MLTCHSCAGSGAQLIAEGVETQELLEVVACSGLDACQGWLWPGGGGAAGRPAGSSALTDGA
jgi:EAL domain-containing protein (putative c-di-GMP-specific phosphodiesterase class I)